MKLLNQVALITGAASGIGKAQAELFAREGAKIIAVDIEPTGLKRTVDEIRSAGGDAIGILTDISKENEVKALYKQAAQVFDRIDILCNTAGIFDNLTSIQQTDITLLRKIIGVNIEGTFLMTKHALQSMISNGYGVIVNMASDAGLVGGGGGMAYTMSKHAVIGFTKQLNAELGQFGIRANAIAPGLIRTSMVQDFIVAGSPIMETFQKIPGRRSGDPLDVAQASLFLASKDASYIYGDVLTVDGGLLSTLRF